MKSRDEVTPTVSCWQQARRLDAAEEGTQAIEVILVFTVVILPCFGAVMLLHEVLCEYLEVETTILTSPFF